MGIKEHFEKNAGAYAWAGLAAYVIAADILLPETLSSAADRALEHDKMKYVAWGVGGVVSAHVFNLINPEYDPIEKVADYVAGKLNL